MSVIFSIMTLLIAVVALVVANNSASSATAVATAAPAISVTLKEFSISPAALTAPPGPITIQVTNAGTVVHNYQVVGLAKTRDLQPGESETLSLPLVTAGKYETRCDIAGHKGSGMVGTLEVGAGMKMGAEGGGAAMAMSAEEMDNVMDKVAKQFPAKTAGHGGDLLEPTIGADGVKQFDVTAKIVDWEVSSGKIVKAWTYNGVVPAPLIHVQVGDKVRIVLKNELEESTAIHFHGIRVPNSMDGVPPFTQPPVKPHGTFTYEFTALEPAVGIYHSHSNSQVQVPNGMFGAFLIGDMPLPASAGITKADKEVVMVLNDSGTIGLSLNGKSFPATEPYTLKVGQTMLVHYMNEGLMTHPMHLHQPTGTVIARDGVPLTSPYQADTINVAPGERYTVLYKAIDPGVWAWHCHILNHAEGSQGMFGMVTALIIEP